MNQVNYIFLISLALLFSNCRNMYVRQTSAPVGEIDSIATIATLTPIIQDMMDNRAKKLSADKKTKVNYTLSNISYSVVNLSEADKCTLSGIFMDRNDYADKINYAKGTLLRSYTDSLAYYTQMDSMIRHKAKMRTPHSRNCLLVSYKASLSAASFFEAVDGRLFFDMKFHLIPVSKPAMYLSQMDTL